MQLPMLGVCRGGERGSEQEQRGQAEVPGADPGGG